MRYQQLTAAEKLLVDIINGRELPMRTEGDARLGQDLQGRGLATMTHDGKTVTITPTQHGRNWTAIRGLIETPQPSPLKESSR